MDGHFDDNPDKEIERHGDILLTGLYYKSCECLFQQQQQLLLLLLHRAHASCNVWLLMIVGPRSTNLTLPQL
jgi:hypothetical protein